MKDYIIIKKNIKTFRRKKSKCIISFKIDY